MESMLEKIANSLDEVNSCDLLGEDKSKKLSFVKRQIELLANKKYIMKDYCFGVQSFPHVRY